jgi:hypothetical protein
VCADFFCANFFCANDGAVAGGIEFRGTCHSISRASGYVSDYLSDNGLVGRSRVPASRAANLFFPPRSIIAEAASRMRHNYAVMLLRAERGFLVKTNDRVEWLGPAVC